MEAIPEELQDPQIASYVLTAIAVLSKKQRIAFAKFLLQDTEVKTFTQAQAAPAEPVAYAKGLFQFMKPDWSEMYGEIPDPEPLSWPTNWKSPSVFHYGEGFNGGTYAHLVCKGLTYLYAKNGAKYVYKLQQQGEAAIAYQNKQEQTWLLMIDKFGTLSQINGNFKCGLVIQEDLDNFVNKAKYWLPAHFPPAP